MNITIVNSVKIFCLTDYKTLHTTDLGVWLRYRLWRRRHIWWARQLW